MSAAVRKKKTSETLNSPHTPLLLPAPVPSKKRSRPRAAFGAKAHPSTQTNGRPQTWMLRGFVGRRPFVRVGGEASMTKATSTSREGFIVGLSLFMTNDHLVSPTIFLHCSTTVSTYGDTSCHLLL